MTEVRTYIPQTGVKGIKDCYEVITTLADGRIRFDTFKEGVRQATSIYSPDEALQHIESIQDALGPTKKLIWSDEFDGTTLDSTKWRPEPTNSPPNGELQAFTSRASNISVANSNLVLTARKENYGGKAYTSGKIITKDLFDFTYGRVEAKMKVPAGQGIWTAFWGMGNDVWEVGWPACGEFDIVEVINGDATAVGSLHASDYNVSRWKRYPGLHDDYHIFAMDWEPGHFTWSVDDNVYSDIVLADQHKDVPFSHPFYLIFTLSVGGDWPGPPNAATVFPISLYVDYVRVYQTA